MKRMARTVAARGRIISNWDLYDYERVRAIRISLELWVNNKYRLFVLRKRHESLPALEPKWFKSFVGAWRVARTIRKGKREAVRQYLDKQFRTKMEQEAGPGTVDNAIKYLQRRGWTSRKRKDGTASSARSVVAKIGFFFCPDRIVPYDTFAHQGLNVLRGSKRAEGEGYIYPETYTEYLAAFDREFRVYQQLLVQELNRPWAVALAKRIGCKGRWLRTRRFQRKTFDQFLVQVGMRVNEGRKNRA